MKKSFLLLPLAAVVLAACSSDTSSETSPNVEVTEVGSAWQTEVQQVGMPSSMTQPTYQPQPTYTPPPAPQPTYQPAPQPTY
ncbi:hypothetical protein ACN46H_12615, partial [Glaesserella parasuis]